MAQAKPEILTMLTTRTKCFSCKHRFDKPYILPVDNPKPDRFQPNINVETLVHHKETHGIPPDIQIKWIIGMVYGLGLHEFGARGLENLSTGLEDY